MAIVDTQRRAIETLVNVVGPRTVDLCQLGNKSLTLDGEPLVFCGVSIGRGPHSLSSARVAVFGLGPSEGLAIPAETCDAAVLLRAPTQNERAQWSPGTALHALDAIDFQSDPDGTVQAQRIGNHKVTYVPL